MDPVRWRQVEPLYHAALTRPAAERASFLAQACPDDPALRHEVETLLAATAQGFLSVPATATKSSPEDFESLDLAGRRLGVYQLGERIGAGGMGEVYRARDTRLGRDVAIKILPRAFTDDPDRLARFGREARVLAALNHPNIGTIHGFEEGPLDPPAEAGRIVRGLVLELVEGDTLAERIGRGPVPIAVALDTARQIAEALDTAHEKGIVHRDLKPANVKLTRGGAVKVLDFGLATVDSGRAAGSLAPTITIGSTREGMLLGTAAYMSPEQARGRTADTRTDIWAFGCVLYEMLTGRAAFARETIAETLAGVLEREPEWQALPRQTPPGVVRLLQRCLEKDPARRLRDIGDARKELAQSAIDSNTRDIVPAVHIRNLKALVLAATILGFIVLAAAVAFRTFSGLTPPPRTAEAITSVAVLPLTNMSGRPENEYLADGLALDVMNSLAKHPRLRVVSRTSAFAFKGQNRDVREIARALNVTSIVEGTLHLSGTTLQVSVQLTNANGFSEWSEVFERDLTDLTAIESAISRAVVDKLVPASPMAVNAVLGKPLSANPRAYDLFLRGQYAMAQRSKDGLTVAEAHFQEAVRLDPGFGAAWAALAETVIPLHEVHGVRSAESAYAVATDAARRALTVGTSAAEGHAALAHILVHQYSWRAAEEQANLAVKTNPGSAISHEWLGYSMQALGRLAEAERAYRRAVDLDPLSGAYHYGLAVCVLSRGDAEGAVRLAERGTLLGAGIAVAPGVLANVQLGRFDAAQTMLDRAPDGTPSHILDALRIYVAGRAGKGVEGRRLMAELMTRLPAGSEPGPMMVPFAYTSLGDPDAAVDWLRQSPNAGEFLVEYRLLPDIRALAGNAVMQEMLRRFDFSEP